MQLFLYNRLNLNEEQKDQSNLKNYFQKHFHVYDRANKPDHLKFYYLDRSINHYQYP